jgi:hypothetical protein
MNHFRDFMENKTVIQTEIEIIQVINRNENQNFYKYKFEFGLNLNEPLLAHNQYYYDYFIPNSIDKLDSIKFENINYAELFIDNIYSCPVDNQLEIISCVSYSDFRIRLYFNSLQENFNIKYDAYLFPFQFKIQIANIPFRTDYHIYNNGVVSLY